MHALIEWVSAEQGGRRTLPTGVGEPPYSPHVRFVDEPWPPAILWSFAVRKEREIGDSHHWMAEVRYRLDEAPNETLRAGREFELYEGNKCVARGKLVSESFAPFDQQPATLTV